MNDITEMAAFMQSTTGRRPDVILCGSSAFAKMVQQYGTPSMRSAAPRRYKGFRYRGKLKGFFVYTKNDPQVADDPPIHFIQFKAAVFGAHDGASLAPNGGT